MLELRHWLHVKVAPRHEVKRFCGTKNRNLQENRFQLWFLVSAETASRYDITRSAALHPEDNALPTDNPPLWLPA